MNYVNIRCHQKTKSSKGPPHTSRALDLFKLNIQSHYYKKQTTSKKINKNTIKMANNVHHII